MTFQEEHDAFREEILALIDYGSKIEATKRIRDYKKITLKEAQIYLDGFIAGVWLIRNQNGIKRLDRK